LDRYVRHSALPWFGPQGQEKLKASLVLVVGCGGLGCTCSSFLARAGVGRLRIVDGDIVSITDLHRQVLFNEADVVEMRLKAHVAADRLRQANPSAEIEPVVADFDPGSAEDLAADADLVVDCSDNFETRMLLNEVCRKHSAPWIHGACVGTIGIVIPFPAGAAACYRCVVDHVPAGTSAPSCEEVGILGPVAGIVGSIEAMEALKLLVSPDVISQKIIYLDGLASAWETIGVGSKHDCPVCSGGIYEYLNGVKPWRSREVCTGDTVRLDLGRPIDIGSVISDPPDSVELHDTDGILRLDTDTGSVLLFSDGRAIVRGVYGIPQARALVTSLLRL
jgi:molybdopterin/thiamine biosynthesis adenylyltransferase